MLGRGGYRRGAEDIGDIWIIDGHGSEENENEFLLSTSRREPERRGHSLWGVRKGRAEKKSHLCST